jgi:cysteine synthase A
MRERRSGILQRIGQTPLPPLRRVAPSNGASVLLKLESENPTGSMKDRMALAMIVPLWRADLADRIERVSPDDAMCMALRLAREQGLFAGTSTGANVVAATRLAKDLGPSATVVTIMCDTGMKYLRTFGAALP